MSDDWLETDPERIPALPADVALPDSYAERAALAEAAWGRLDPQQKTFLQAWRDCRYNARAAARQLGINENSKPNTAWMRQPDYALIVRVWRANAAAGALDRDRLLARQDDIVETLLTPKPVLHQGIMVLDTRPGAKTGAVFEEIEAAAAGKANETLMKAAGMLKDKEIEVNVGVVIGPPTLNIQVMPTPPSKVAVLQSVPIDAKFTEVPSDDEWLGT